MIHFIYRFLASLLLLGISVLTQAQDYWGSTEYKGKPWVKNISHPYSIEKGLQNNMPIDMIELDIRNIWEILGTINGSTYEEELLDEMFSRFCLGK